MPSKWGTKISYRGIGFFCCFFRLHLNSRVGNFWLACLQHKTQQMNEQHKYSLFPYWSVDALHEQFLAAIWSSYCKKITSRNDFGNRCDEIDSVPVHFISKRKKEGAQRRLSVILTRSWCLLSSCWCWCYPPPFLHLPSSDHLKPESLTPRSGLCHQFHLWSPCFRFQRTGIAVRVRHGPR